VACWLQRVLANHRKSLQELNAVENYFGLTTELNPLAAKSASCRLVSFNLMQESVHSVMRLTVYRVLSNVFCLTNT
jgi:hypothetical protein